MAIYYYDEYTKKFNSRNFGDDINPFIFDHLLPERIIEDDKICIIGVGTLINEATIQNVAHFEKKIVFSSGVGYSKKGDDLNFDDSWIFICVRGPLSSEKLKLPKSKGVTDGAIFLSQILKLKETKKDGIAFIPHVNTHWTCGPILENLCKSIGIEYLVPDVEFDTFIKVVAESKCVITEAMHGAILADTVRTPWYPIKIHNALPFKWQDWCQSMELDYTPVELPPLWYKENLNLYRKSTLFVKTKIMSTKIKGIIKNDAFILSDEVVFDKKLSAMNSKLDELIDTFDNLKANT